ncbi:MAG: hypothetical protein HRU70_06685 [Phycisphaeraceae bacterium]|nr:MAG: hypothetical protein HRU70_06685 [Phycisphaeraceae bacterium]
MASKRGTATLRGVTTDHLQAELVRRQQGLPSLYKQLERAQANVQRLVSAIEALGGSAGAGGVSGRHRRGLGPRKRPKNDSNLIEALAKLLKGKTMSVTEASQKVQQAGYKTTAANFRTIVNQTLIKSDKFKKISRGQYTAA